MRYVDFHSDTFYRMKECSTPQSLKQNGFHIDINKLKNAGTLLQCFALYTDLEKHGTDGGWQYVQDLYQLAIKELRTCDQDIQWVRSFQEIRQAETAKRQAAMLTLEEGGVIGTDLSRIERLYVMGVRIASLTWNYANTLGHSSAVPEDQGKGLTFLGREAVLRMQQLGMLVDVSHLSDQGTRDVLSIAHKPIIATHSNARAITDHPRNLPDGLIRSIGESGGVIGLNFCSRFLNDRGESMQLADFTRHLKHMISVGGEEVVAIGTDFDGIGGPLEIAHAGEMNKLVVYLEKRSIPQQTIEKLLRGNALRILAETLK